MSAHADRVDGLPVELEGGRSTGWWGMGLFITTEIAIFGSALASYFYLRSQAPTWPPAGIEEPDILYGSILTVVLLSSSIPIWFAERSIRHGRTVGLRAGFAVALVLALIFLAMQAFEWHASTFTQRDGAYGSLWFTITGLHGAHVIGAVLIVGLLLVRAFRGHFDEDHHLAVSVAAWYWHFVDVVWVLIFVSLYLSPHL